MIKVLFVCLGNICRSPMAEGLLKKYAEEQHLELFVDSAATSRWEVGNPPHPGTKNILKREQIDFQNMVARQIRTSDFDTFDWIIGMDHENVQELLAQAPKDCRANIHLFMEAVTDKETLDVPDP